MRTTGKAKYIVVVSLAKPKKMLLGTEFKKHQVFTQMCVTKKEADALANGFVEYGLVMIMPIRHCLDIVSNVNGVNYAKELQDIKIVI